MQLLAIGNSFSSDATRYLHGIARAGGVPLQVTNLYIGGCSLERHFRNMHSDARAYDLQCNGHSILRMGQPGRKPDAGLDGRSQISSV